MKIVQSPDWRNIQQIYHFLTINANTISENLPSSFRNFQIQKLSKHYSDSENPFNHDYFVYLSSNFVNFVFNDIITLGKMK